MFSPINSILGRLNTEGRKLKVLTSFTHESFETGLCKTDCEFYSYFTKGLKRWNNSRPLPQNYYTLPDDTVPNMHFDIVLAQTRWGQYQALKPIAQQRQIPLVVLEHTDRMPHWNSKQVAELRTMEGDINIFITDYSRERWGWGKEEAQVIRHGIDTNIFTPGNQQRKPHILSVVNDWANRDYICGFTTWKKVTKGLPVFPVGDTKGFSLPSSSTEELVNFYQTSRVFINTSLLSPLPTSLIEAMACGCACVSTNNCAIPEAIEHGVNGFLTNDEKEMGEYCKLLLEDAELARTMGEKARQTIVEKFNQTRFISEWNGVFKKAIEL